MQGKFSSQSDMEMYIKFKEFMGEFEKEKRAKDIRIATEHSNRKKLK